MAFADLKNDFVFRRIFATHPDILCGLLNDLLDRRDDETIVSIEYPPSEELPLVAGTRLSILDVRCKDRAGTHFVVGMQLLHIAGFINRVVYNACTTYVNQRTDGDRIETHKAFPNPSLHSSRAATLLLTRSRRACAKGATPSAA